MSETLLFGAIGGAGLGLAALGSLVYARVRSYRRQGEQDAGEEFPLESDPAAGAPPAPFARYQPMFRLLTGEDADFLRRNQSCSKVVDRWAKSQRRVVRLYLRELAGDFQDLHRRARALAAQSPEQYSYLLPLLFRQQVAFWRALIWIDIGLSLGNGFVRIHPEALIAAFEALQREISRPRLQQSQPA